MKFVRKDMRMNYLKQALNNQALGVLPLLATILADIYFFSYFASLIIGLTLGLVGMFFLYRPAKGQYLQLLLLPSVISLLLYSVFLIFDFNLSYYADFPIVAEIMLVIVLVFFGFSRKYVLFRIRHSGHSPHQRMLIRTRLDEAYFMGQIIQNIYTLHLFILLVYLHLPSSMKNQEAEDFLYKHLALLIGVIVILYGQLRVQVLREVLKKETWLPVLDEKGKVIGSMARSVSRLSSKKYFHPIVRVAVIYNGMLYLSNRGKDEYVSPELLDHPFQRYVLFRRSVDEALKSAMGELVEDKSTTPRFMIRYTFENENAKHLVSLYTICLRTEEELKKLTGGKLWTSNQIQENLNSKIFSEYFKKEFPYLQNTILLAENVYYGNNILS